MEERAGKTTCGFFSAALRAAEQVLLKENLGGAVFGQDQTRRRTKIHLKGRAHAGSNELERAAERESEQRPAHNPMARGGEIHGPRWRGLSRSPRETAGSKKQQRVPAGVDVSHSTGKSHRMARWHRTPSNERMPPCHYPQSTPLARDARAELADGVAGGWMAKGPLRDASATRTTL